MASDKMLSVAILKNISWNLIYVKNDLANLSLHPISCSLSALLRLGKKIGKETAKSWENEGCTQQVFFCFEKVSMPHLSDDFLAPGL